MIFQRLLTIWVLLIELWILCEAKNKNKKPIGSVIQPARSSYGGSVNKPPYPVSNGSVNNPPYPVNGGSVNKPPYPVSNGSTNNAPYPRYGGSAPYPSGSVNKPPYPVSNGSTNNAPYPRYGGSAPYPNGSINKPPYPVPGGGYAPYPSGPSYNASYPIPGKNKTKPSGSINKPPYPVQDGSINKPPYPVPAKPIFPYATGSGPVIYPHSSKIYPAITIAGRAYLNGRSVTPTSSNYNTMKSQLCSTIQSAITEDSTLANSFRSCAVRKLSTDKVDTSISWDTQHLRPKFSSVSSNSFQSRVRSVILNHRPVNLYYYGTITRISGASIMNWNFTVTSLILVLVTCAQV